MEVTLPEREESFLRGDPFPANGDAVAQIWQGPRTKPPADTSYMGQLAG